jgi:hypothetical protein
VNNERGGVVWCVRTLASGMIDRKETVGEVSISDAIQRGTGSLITHR